MRPRGSLLFIFALGVLPVLTGCGGTKSKVISISASGGATQSAKVGTAFGTSLSVTVMHGSSPLSGASVTFTAPSSGASGTFSGGATTDTATTNAQGVATASTFTAGTKAGSYTVSATTSGAASPATFSLSNTAASPASITASAGATQSATVGTAFGTALEATVSDSDGNPVSGVSVTFTAPASGASGAFSNGANTETDSTNSSGVATASTFTANATVGGPFTVTANFTGNTGAPASFSLTNTAAPVIAVVVSSGSGQSAAVSTSFASPLVALVTSNGSPKSGVSVTFTAPASGASGTFSNGTATETDTTNANGLATSSTFKANATAGGPYSVTATTSGAAAPASFTLTNTAAPVIAVAVSSGSGQSATVSTSFASPLVALVTSNGSPESGASVTFTAPASGASGTFSNGTATETDTTNANGLATSSAFKANATAGGPYTVTATTSGAAAPASFALTNTATAVIAISASSGSGQSATVSTSFASPLVALVTSNGSPESGASVTFTAPASGASGTFSNGMATEIDTTNANGLATSSAFTANSTAGGPYTVTATTTGASSPADFSLTNTSSSGSNQTIQAIAGTPQLNENGDSFTIPLVARVLGSTGTPVANVAVTFTAPTTGATATFASTNKNTETDMTNADGIAISSEVYSSYNQSSGAFTVKATTPNAASAANFSLTDWDEETLCYAPLPSSASALENYYFAPLYVLTTDCNGNPVEDVGEDWGNEAGATGAEGFFIGDFNSNITTIYTQPNGLAAAGNLQANNATGSYQMSAPLNLPGEAVFNLTNQASAVLAFQPNSNYVFYLQGEDVVDYPLQGGGANFGGEYAYEGAFTVGSNGTTISQGEQTFVDECAYLAGVTTPEPITGGSIGGPDVNGNYQITLNFMDGYIGNPKVNSCSPASAAGSVTFSALFTSATHALLIENDGFGSANGTIDLQSATLAAPSGGYAFELGGWALYEDEYATPAAMGGVINVDGKGTISGKGSVLDINDAGGTLSENNGPGVLAGLGVSGTISPSPDSYGFVTMQLNPAWPSTSAWAGFNILLSGYMIDNNHIKLLENPGGNDIGGWTGGVALGQGSNTGKFNGNSINNYAYVVGLTGLANESGGGFDQAAGILAFNPDGSVSGNFSFNNLVSKNPAQGGATLAAESTTPCLSGLAATPCFTIDLPGVGVDGGTGRVSLTNVTDGATFNYNLELYLTGDGHALVMSMDPGTPSSASGYAGCTSCDWLYGTGTMQYDPYAYFGNSSNGQWFTSNFSGPYALDLTEQSAGAGNCIAEFGLVCEEDAVGLINAGANVTGTLDENEVVTGGDSGQSLSISAAYTGSNGPFAGPGIVLVTSPVVPPATSPTTFTLYMMDLTQGVIIENDSSEETLGYYDEQ